MCEAISNQKPCRVMPRERLTFVSIDQSDSFRKRFDIDDSQDRPKDLDPNVPYRDIASALKDIATATIQCSLVALVSLLGL